MKNRLSVKAVFQNVVLIALFVVFLTGLTGWSTPVMISIGAVLLAASFIPNQHSGFASGIYREAWDSEVIRRFNTADQNSWRQGIRDLGRYFSMLQDGETVVVNLTFFGVSPDVLINNTSYPIAVQALDGENVAVTVHKFQTKATPITDDEMFGLNYDKIRTVQEAHVIKIEEEKNAMGLHSITPTANTANTPVLLTTGDLVDGRRMLRKKDLLTLRKSLDDKKVPAKGRRLVFCNDHVIDLLEQDQKFNDQYYNYATGKIANVAGFEIFEFTDAPFINVTNKQKLAYGGVPTSDHTRASVFFHVGSVVQGKGFTKTYLSESGKDPLNQRNLLNYRHYDIVTPYKQQGIGAVASATS